VVLAGPGQPVVVTAVGPRSVGRSRPVSDLRLHFRSLVQVLAFKRFSLADADL